jgi:hypothetical protein
MRNYAAGEARLANDAKATARSDTSSVKEIDRCVAAMLSA